MTKNTISVTAYIVTGSDIKILLNESPHQAIEKYLCPDMRPPIENILIEAMTDDGKLEKISITQERIYATIV